ncbi:hypothetical protein [Evansella tamaricis]|uniref:ATP-binding protein n=1 Tax=Evansella tamaricis TaxID=2069301 RepID=A0ABS6JKS0_9BACI|nr:hypothetical protein [Evansella tamaricis]MBU9714274.1 hypothetical protein [Evansella tamaricis]
MERKLIIITGHFGSGKTELSLFYSEKMANETKMPVTLCDLDVINPYFRSRDYKEHLCNNNIHLLAPQGDLLLADLPIVTGEVSAMIENTMVHGIIDVGGDKDGALALGQFSNIIKKGKYELWFVVNGNRPYVSTVEGVIQTVDEIETASRLQVTGIINNTHLGDDIYGPEEVIKGERIAVEVSEKKNIPYMFSFINKKAWDRWVEEGTSPEAKNVTLFERKLLAPWN